jgi:hypothetical protein
MTGKAFVKRTLLAACAALSFLAGSLGLATATPLPSVGKSWTFAGALAYQSAIFDAGRAVSISAHDAPAYAELAAATVDVATRLHYDALLNDDACVWYVREAAQWVKDHGTPEQSPAAAALLAKIAAGDASSAALAVQAEDDARAEMADFRHDPAVAAQLAVADARAYNLTHDPRYRRLARVPAATTAIPRALRLLRTAPADEYFGQTRLSPLGVGNEFLRIAKYLDAGWGAQMAPDALYLASSLEEWQRQYPHDPTLPRHLLDYYGLLQRVDAPATISEAAAIRALVLVQYAGSAQALALAAQH